MKLSYARFSVRAREITTPLVLYVLTAGLLFVGCNGSSPSEPVEEYVAGESYFGSYDYIEYIAGNLPIIVSAPHGGYLEPAEIPDRTWGTTVRDSNIQELARSISRFVNQRSGGFPHIVICLLRRTKLDANRDIEEAAQDNQYAEQAWYDYHHFIDLAKQAVIEDYGGGFFIDLHGHGHDIQRLELGYLLSGSELDLLDEELDQPSYISKSSIRTLAEESGANFIELLRGPSSLGSLLEAKGYPSVPSASQPGPGGQPYYSGGYNTWRHGSRDGGRISGVQIECNWAGVRENASDRWAFSEALAEVLETYLMTYFEIDIGESILVGY